MPIITIRQCYNDEEKRCAEAGMNGFISKPYTEKALLDKILTTLEKTGKMQKNRHEPEKYGGAIQLSALKAIARDNTALLKKC